MLFAQTVTPSRRARNALRLYPQDFAGLHDAGLVEPWFDIDTMWHDEALTIAQAVEDHRVTTPTVWVVETRGSGDEGMAQLTAAGYHLVQQRHFDIDTVYEELKAKGAEFTKHVFTQRPGIRVMFLRGPQGVSIELLERSDKYQ